MKKAVIIVAGGVGTRMGNELPKQFLLMNGRPILMQTIQRFYDYDPKVFILTVLPAGQMEAWHLLIKKYSFPVSHSLVTGGPTRFESVKKGLDKITWPCTVAVHDGVRPLCSKKLIDRCFSEAILHSNAIPSLAVSDSIREIKTDTTKIVDRSKLRIIQTPQCFDADKLKRAYSKSNATDFTDDASVYEMDGNKLNLIEGDKCNLKITIPEDLAIASAIEKELMRRI